MFYWLTDCATVLVSLLRPLRADWQLWCTKTTHLQSVEQVGRLKSTFALRCWDETSFDSGRTAALQTYVSNLKPSFLYFTALKTVEAYWFLPRDAMRKRDLCCRSVSVCLSVTFVYGTLTTEDIVKLFSRPDSPIILVFWPRARRWYPTLRGTHQRGAKYMHGVGKFAIFKWNQRLSRKR